MRVICEFPYFSSLKFFSCLAICCLFKSNLVLIARRRLSRFLSAPLGRGVLRDQFSAIKYSRSFCFAAAVIGVDFLVRGDAHDDAVVESEA